MNESVLFIKNESILLSKRKKKHTSEYIIFEPSEKMNYSFNQVKSEPLLKPSEKVNILTKWKNETIV